MSNVEQVKYTVIQNDGKIEIRDYPSFIVAETEVCGAQRPAISNGFRLIADYIFGHNISSKKIAMTAPVTQQSGGFGVWEIRFIMPSSYTIQSLPCPKNDRVKIKTLDAKRFAVIRFSGIGNQKRLDQEQKKLEEFIVAQNLTPLAKPIYAFFNPPWTLPFFRRNEVMIEIK